jgi:hypothetical protein
MPKKYIFPPSERLEDTNNKVYPTVFTTYSSEDINERGYPVDFGGLEKKIFLIFLIG